MNNQTVTINHYDLPSRCWSNFYLNSSSLRTILKKSREERLELINKELEPFHATAKPALDNKGVLLTFESEAYYNWFLIRWS